MPDPHQEYLIANRSEVLQLSESSLLIEIISHIKSYVEKTVANVLSTHQLRNIYAEVKKAETTADLHLLRPNLAYIAARQADTEKAKKVVEFLDEMIQGVKLDQPKQLEGYKSFLESIVAYHKLYTKKS